MSLDVLCTDRKEESHTEGLNLRLYWGLILCSDSVLELVVSLAVREALALSEQEGAFKELKEDSEGRAPS